jgi:hypothetical protein
LPKNYIGNTTRSKGKGIMFCADVNTIGEYSMGIQSACWDRFSPLSDGVTNVTISGHYIIFFYPTFL